MDASISLKTEFEVKTESKQCEIFHLLWLDSNAEVHRDQETEQKLRSIINCLQKFQQVKPCQTYIEQSSDMDRIVLIVSGQLGQEIVRCIHDLRQVISIYVFCFNKKFHETWSSKYSKVKSLHKDSLYYF